MKSLGKTRVGDPDTPVLAQIEMPWGFRIRPADMEAKATDTVVEWGMNFLGMTLILAAFAQWLLPSTLFVGNPIMVKFVMTCILGLVGGLLISSSARGFRPEVQIDRVRNEVRFVSRNPRGRGEILATVDIDQVIGVGMTKSIDGPDCHCLIYLIDGRKPLRLATGTEKEIRVIREKMSSYVTSPADRLAARMSQPRRRGRKSEKTAA